MKPGWPEEARQFLELFGRTEHALKQLGFLKKKKRAEADWVRFADELGAAFYDRIVASGAAKVILNEPPRARMAASFAFEPALQTPIVDGRELFLRGVCQVRNNFAHGEKFVVSGLGWDRDLQLIRDAHWILKEAISAHPGLRNLA